MIFARNKQINHGGNPQYLPGEFPPVFNPGSFNPQLAYLSDPAHFSSGFHDGDIKTFHLSFGYRPQPDMGGALNYAYELYGLPLDNVCGPWMVARHPTLPCGSQPLAFFHVAPPTSIGGLIPGQIIAQPLLDPNNPGAGYDIYS